LVALIPAQPDRLPYAAGGRSRIRREAAQLLGAMPSTEHEDRLLERVRTLTHARRTAEVVATLEGELDGMLSGERSRPFTGIAFDAYCRSLLAARGHGDDVRRAVALLCERSRARFGAQPWSDLYEACLAHLAGDDESAAARYAMAARDVDVLWPSSAAARTVVAPSRRDAWLGDETPLPCVRVERPRPAGGPVVLVGCDRVYLRRYGPAYLRSFARFGEDVTLHVHLTDPLPDDIAWLRDASPATWDRTAVTTETYVGPDPRPYYALARFLRLGELLERYDAPVLVTDLDAVFERPIADNVSDAAGADAALTFKRTDYRAHPWNTVRAGALIVQPTERGRTFARALRRVGAALFTERAGRGAWFIDQNVLYSVFRRFENERGYRFADISGSLPGGLRHGKAF
jgi:hypothetical protein